MTSETRTLTAAEWRDAAPDTLSGRALYITEASTLRLVPGDWPLVIVTPEGAKLRPIASNAQRVTYANATLSVRLVIIND